MNSKVVAVFTTFKPEESFYKRIAASAGLFFAVVIIDDTGQKCSHIDDVSFLGDLTDVYLINNDRNAGIAHSLNKGIKKALELSADYIVTFDDDTIFSPDYINTCLNFFKKTDLPNIGAISLARGEEFSAGSDICKTKRVLITSGLFCKSTMYCCLNEFPEEYFIDLVDFFFSLELRKRGFSLFELGDVGMIHKVGNINTIKFPIKINVFNHSPFRLYYQVRNAIPFFKRFWKVDFLLCSYVLLDTIRIPVKALLFEDRKIERVKYCAKGFLDGVFGRMGRLND